MILKKGEHFIDRLNSDLLWYTLYEPQAVWKNKEAAAKRVGEMLDEDPTDIFRIRDYLGGVVWQTPKPQGERSGEKEIAV